MVVPKAFLYIQFTTKFPTKQCAIVDMRNLPTYTAKSFVYSSVTKFQKVVSIGFQHFGVEVRPLCKSKSWPKTTNDRSLKLIEYNLSDQYV